MKKKINVFEYIGAVVGLICLAIPCILTGFTINMITAYSDVELNKSSAQYILEASGDNDEVIELLSGEYTKDESRNNYYKQLFKDENGYKSLKTGNSREIIQPFFKESFIRGYSDKSFNAVEAKIITSELGVFAENGIDELHGLVYTKTIDDKVYGYIGLGTKGINGGKFYYISKEMGYIGGNITDFVIQTVAAVNDGISSPFSSAVNHQVTGEYIEFEYIGTDKNIDMVAIKSGDTSDTCFIDSKSNEIIAMQSSNLLVHYYDMDNISTGDIDITKLNDSYSDKVNLLAFLMYTANQLGLLDYMAY